MDNSTLPYVYQSLAQLNKCCVPYIFEGNSFDYSFNTFNLIKVKKYDF